MPSPPPLLIPSVEDTVYRALREEIGSLRLAPDARLRLEELASRYGVSLTPVRQALRRLESDGLVATAPRRGSFVAPLSVAEVEEIQALRIGLESLLARYGAQNSTRATVAEMAERRKAVEEAYERGDLAGYIAAFWSFRDVCYLAADRPRLLAALAAQRRRVERYILFLCRDVDAAAQLREPPDRLLLACERRDGDDAEASTREGLMWVLGALREMLDGRTASADA
jgi:DNA-binding GntR family transcriptional regulator